MRYPQQYVDGYYARQTRHADNGTFGYAGLAVDARHPNAVMVSTMDWWSHHDDVFRSTDGGAHFTTVGGVHGVFRSDTAGASWVRINDDAHQYGWIEHEVIGDPRVYGRVYLAANGRGILYADPAP